GIAEFVRLEDCPIMPPTPTVITPSGGRHLYYKRPSYPLGCSADDRYAPGIDIRAGGGYVVVPAPNSGYHLSRWHFGNCTPKSAPDWLRLKKPERPRLSKPIEPTAGLSRYAAGALDCAERAILAAMAGAQEQTLVRECFSIGTLAGAGGVPEGFAR